MLRSRDVRVVRPGHFPEFVWLFVALAGWIVAVLFVTILYGRVTRIQRRNDHEYSYYELEQRRDELLRSNLLELRKGEIAKLQYLTRRRELNGCTVQLTQDGIDDLDKVSLIVLIIVVVVIIIIISCNIKSLNLGPSV